MCFCVTASLARAHLSGRKRQSDLCSISYIMLLVLCMGVGSLVLVWRVLILVGGLCAKVIGLCSSIA